MVFMRKIKVFLTTLFSPVIGILLFFQHALGDIFIVVGNKDYHDLSTSGSYGTGLQAHRYYFHP